MLERYVDVVADVAVACNGIDGVVGEGGRVGVVQAYPFSAGLGGQPVEQRAQTAFAIEVQTVVGGILRNDNQLFDALGDHPFGFVQNVLDRARLVAAANHRDGAVRAAAVAAFGNLQECVMLWSALNSFGLEAFAEFGFQRVDQFFPFAHAVEAVDFRQLCAKLVAVAFYEASDGDDAPCLASALLDFDLFQQCVDRLLFGVADEAAGVDDDDVAVVAATVEMYFKSSLCQMAGQMLRIGSVF